MRTLRVFSAGERNCYSVDVPGGGQILVRASFFYGNYDGRHSPPTFGLEFDGNRWAAVRTAEDEVVQHEAIYVARGGRTSVCVVRTKAGELPFVSAIEVRALGEKMYGRYDRNTSALVLAGRVAAGRYVVRLDRLQPKFVFFFF
ncbi:Uncharacterized protein AXF42_Ash008763 [Apostasia shenzhenica]|uniref:Malectin-like domain-containing protein n=1 Tax=Apostasia shenzhenica TaxID=1088818 RepID=A0A2I0ASM5_9ASPA|nr:Uncharacterized protein AXF42_Ash008763 [Apostasia shenzhenica]